ncbi:hypothetical protein [Candidatus Magnetaquicoccus inordinatus]|uniref:hypothetical protein n=1 Tax=Candidatus Magnetaquicoccus inordinatus TaxID=2496818 RepID=UPI00102AD71D|nr:hypothetical protein [Candidatus Magnetaquicoccus inordinatus]
MESTAFRRLDVGRVAGVETESGFFGSLFFFVLHRFVSSDKITGTGYAVFVIVVFSGVEHRQKAFYLLVVHPAEHHIVTHISANQAKRGST